MTQKVQFDIAKLNELAGNAVDTCKKMGDQIVAVLKASLKQVYPNQRFSYEIKSVETTFANQMRVKVSVSKKNGNRIDCDAMVGLGENGYITLSHWDHRYGRDILTDGGDDELIIGRDINQNSIVDGLKYIEAHRNKWKI